MDLLVLLFLVAGLLFFLACGLWIGLSVVGVGWVGMALFSDRAIGDSMAISIWGTLSSWTLSPLPLFLWMGEILFRTKLSEDMFKGLAPWFSRIPGRLLHTNILGCAIFAAVSGSSSATCATIGKMTLPELNRRGYPERMTIGTLAGAGTLGLLIPPSIIMIVYGVSANVSITGLFIAGVLPGLLLTALFTGYTMLWSIFHPEQIPPPDRLATLGEKLYASRHLIPVAALIVAVLGSIYGGIATATEAAAMGVIGALLIALVQGSLSWRVFLDSLLGTAHLYCMIAFILGASAFLTLSMGYLGMPRELAEFIVSLNLSQFELLVALLIFYLILGCFLDGISMVVLSMGVLLPTILKVGIDPLWFGIFVVLVVETAQITPPVGFNLFVLQGLTGWQMTSIAAATFPLFVLMIVAVILIYVFPEIVTWLPAHL